MTIEDPSSYDPAVHLTGMDVEGASEYIDAMERDGQRQLLNSTELPRRAKPNWDTFEALGIRRGEDTGGPDGLFCQATLPDGWTREPSHSPMWSDILDQHGLKRASVFYQANFYAREAFITTAAPGIALAGKMMKDADLTQLPALWNVLTDDERKSFRDDLYQTRDFIEENPREDYGRMARIEAIIALID